MSHSFKQLPLPAAQQDNLTELGYFDMTDIQQASLPDVLSGKDVIGQAKTGSGKTVAFGLRLIDCLHVKFFAPQALVLCPTRELAGQVANALRKLARYQQNIKIITLSGGMPLGPQFASLEKGGHIIVGTPGRVKDLIQKGKLDLSEVKVSVLDEADRMLEMGFHEDVEMILNECKPDRQSLLFSATFNAEIEKIAQTMMIDPVWIKGTQEDTPEDITHHFFEVEHSDKPEALFSVLQQFLPKQVMLFCNTKAYCQEISDYLNDHGIVTRALHGDMEQKERDQTLTLFSNQSITAVVATDVAARGLDIANMPCVINVDLPKQIDVFVHRVGRTGRNKSKGQAITFITSRQKNLISNYEELISQSIRIKTITEKQQNKLPLPEFQTIMLASGKKDKIRPGDIVGALTQGAGVNSQDIGDINVLPVVTYVAINRKIANHAVGKLSRTKIKNRSIKMRLVD
ncbi:ATP-dependent RNA helicase DbpA [Marinicellulosiphila megalodicopiae]|uniref:ATP-dependent RNA helicase DbpA n=1 Tax=Marinicellulosiphila megalodicopiae TaxID=2724896 RepID=UPI003BB11378